MAAARAPTILLAVRLLHTLVWAFFVACIVLLPVAAHLGHFTVAALLAGCVLLEVVVLALNGWRCPLTDVAARHTAERGDNFDIFLPRWLARHNKAVFGALFVAGLGYALWRWWAVAPGA